MANLLSGLGKYGLDETAADKLFEEDDEDTKDGGIDMENNNATKPKEEEYLLLKSVRCPICDKVFRGLFVKTGRARRSEPDLDLRPRSEYIDTTKYDVTSCPHCGFTSLDRYFLHLSTLQTRMIRDGVCAKLKNPPLKEISEVRVYSYDEAIELLKLALYTTIVKRGATSEKAFECLKIAWLFRGKIEELEKDEKSKEKNKEAILKAKAEYQSFYEQAYDGFVKAMSSESYPICGMDQNTMDLLLAGMSFNLEKYEYASRLVAGLLMSKTAGRNIKNRAYDLKEKIIEEIHKKDK